MKKMYTSAVLLLIAYSSFSQDVFWAKQFKGYESIGIPINTLDKTGNILITGEFGLKMDLDPGPDSTMLKGKGWGDIFICKLDSEGTFLWAKSIGSTLKDKVLSTLIDKENNIYIAGFFEEKADFDPGLDSFYLTPKGDADAFLCKLDSNGNFVWAKQFGGKGRDVCFSAAFDDNENIYLTGGFRMKADFDPGTDSVILTPKGSIDAFICKLDTKGDFVWVKQIEGCGSYGIDLDNNNNIYITGYFSGTLDFDPSDGVFNMTGFASYVCKLNSSGEFVWAKSMKGGQINAGNKIEVTEKGHIYIAGEFNMAVDFDPGPSVHTLQSSEYLRDVFILKLDTSGNFIWAKSFYGPGDDYGKSFAIDSEENIYITGTLAATADVDPGTSVYNLTGYSNYMVKLSATGNLIWASKLSGGTGYSIAISKKDDIYFS